jgi:hypothetical protein
MALMGDDQAAGVRQLLLTKTSLRRIEAFPQKDNPHQRVFSEAKLSTAIFVATNGYTGEAFSTRVHPGRFIEPGTPVLRLTPDAVLRFDSVNTPLLACTPKDWDIVSRITQANGLRRLAEVCTAHQGEINETVDTRKGLISKESAAGPKVLRGSSITLYVVREASQGEAMYLRKEKYLKTKKTSEKARHHEQARIGWQESSAQNNFRRLIAARIEPGQFCNHKINYVPERECAFDLDLLLAVLNSQISDWFFRLSSTNAAVSHYQIYSLPAPQVVTDTPEVLDWEPLVASESWVDLANLMCDSCTTVGIMPRATADALAAMSRRIQEIEAARELMRRSDRSRLAAESQPIQDAIDRVLFCCYGLSDAEARYIESRLAEML